MFHIQLITLALVSFSPLTISIGFKPLDEQIQIYPCTCPSLKRPVCFLTPSGILETYDNICIANCVLNGAEDGGGKSSTSTILDTIQGQGQSLRGSFDLLPRSFCSSSDNFHVNWADLSSEGYIEKWVEETRKEAKMFQTVNHLLQKLLQVSSPPDAGYPCMCPGIIRPVYKYGSSGTIVRYNNLCAMKCDAVRTNTVLVVHPGALSSSLKMNMNDEDEESCNWFCEDREDREERQLKEWIQAMEDEIEFYREIHEAMQGLFVDKMSLSSSTSLLRHPLYARPAPAALYKEHNIETCPACFALATFATASALSVTCLMLNY